MNNLLLHPRTKLQIDNVISNQPHGLLICGRPGSGKDTLAETMAANLLELDPAKLSTYEYCLIIDPEDKSISIDEIRSLQQFLKLKVPQASKTAVNRAVIIKRAARMRSEAQNALLKTLEEPPAGTVLILTADSTDSLLSTITSRVQILDILPVEQQAAVTFFSSGGKSGPKLTQSYALSQGQPGLLKALLDGDEHPLADSVNQAKQILTEPAGKRLLRTDELTKDKEGVKTLLGALLRITHAALIASSNKNDKRAISQWYKRQDGVISSISAFDKNANTKLLLDNLFLML